MRRFEVAGVPLTLGSRDIKDAMAWAGWTVQPVHLFLRGTTRVWVVVSADPPTTDLLRMGAALVTVQPADERRAALSTQWYQLSNTNISVIPQAQRRPHPTTAAPSRSGRGSAEPARTLRRMQQRKIMEPTV